MKEVYPRSKMEEHDEMYYLNNASTDCSRKLLTESLCNNQDTSQRPVWGIRYEFEKRKTWGLHLQVQVYLPTEMRSVGCAKFFACVLFCVCCLFFSYFCGPSVSEQHNLSMPFCNNYCQCLSLSNTSQFVSLHTRNTLKHLTNYSASCLCNYSHHGVH